MKRTAIRRRVRADGPTAPREVKPWARPTVRPVSRGTYAGSTSGTPVAKENALQHAGYMDAVRSLARCMRCGRGLLRAVFCHRDCGKGTGLKTDCREGWAGCDECHHLVGTSGQLPKPVRRAVELMLGALTRHEVGAAGAWPAGLPAWEVR
jgi:hypothetical protein